MQEFVFEPKKDKIYPHEKADAEDKEGRVRKSLDHLMQLDIVKKANLNESELGAVRLYTGPMFSLYNRCSMPPYFHSVVHSLLPTPLALAQAILVSL
jgi:hypothetical protein